MERIKRALSLVLCFVMVFGLMPASIFAAEGDTHHLMFATDRHANTSVIGEIINNMESAIGENKLEYLGLGGDMVGSGKTHPEYNSSEVLTEATNATSSLNADNVDIVAGIHDMNVKDDAGIVLPYQGGGAQIYEGDDYYVYGVEEYCISEDSNEQNWSARAQAFVDWANGDEIDKSKVIIVVSHYPLHVKRDDNDGAYYWHQALNTVATGGDETVERDIVFFHGHNHTEDSNEYVYNVGNTMEIQNGSSTVSDTIYYTYATAGYLNQNSKATLVTLTDDTIVLTKYSTSGAGTVMATVERVEQETAPTVNTVEDTEDTTKDIVTASGLGLTGVTLTQSESADTSAFQSGCVAYDVALEGYVEGETVTLTFDIGYMDSTDLVVYANGTEITPVSVEDNVEEDGFYSVLVTVETTSATGTYVIGKLAAAEDAVLTGIEVTAMPTTTNYTLVMDEADDGNIYLDITGLVISAVYDDGSKFPVEWNEFDETIDGYALSFDITEAGVRTVTVTYGGFETSFDVTVYEPNAVDADVSEAVADVLKDGYIAKEFNPTDYTEGTEIRVIMPAPENANVVYHVADDGTLTKIENVTFHDGYVIFDTNHFSAYVVGQSTEIEVPDHETATGSGEITTTTTKTVYVLTSSISSGNEYLIVNGNSAGSRYALANNSGSVAATGVTVKTDSEIGTYIELDDAADELWTVGGSYTFQNNGSYLGYTTSGNWNPSYTFGLSSTARTWSYSNNRLSTRVGSDWSTTTYYLRYNSGWTWTSSSNSASSIYFYVPTEVEVETTTTASGTYSIAGENVTVVVASDGSSTAELKSTLTFTPTSGTATTTDTSATATYTVVEGGDPNGVISGINSNTVTFSGVYGKALVKVSYTTDFGVVTNYITVEASAPYYTIQLHLNENGTLGEEITAPVALKGIEAGDTYSVWAVVKEHTSANPEGVDLGELGNALTWRVSDESIATIDATTGVITFTGENYGTFEVTVSYTGADGKVITDRITISATESQYIVPGDGTNDFPEYPDQGAIRFDKNATAVGSFSQTGIAKVELSMTGVPYSTGSEIDVVIMLDMTGSMSTTAMTAAEESAIAFAEQIVKNEDGSFNNNRICVMAFNSGSSSPFTYWSMGTISESQWDSFCTAVRGASEDKVSGGTPYDEALEKCQSVLNEAKTTNLPADTASAEDYSRQQFCVFVSDGGPTSYQYITNYDAVKAGTASAYTTKTASASGGSNQSDSNFATIATYTHEYYSTLMKDDGVTMFSVLTGLSASSYPNCATILENIASSSDNAYVVENGSDTSALTGALGDIAKKIVEAAKNVVVEDKIGEDYTVNFSFPNNGVTAEDTGMDEWYIQVLEYQLDANKERTGDPTVLENFTFNANGALVSHTVNGTVTCEGTACTHVTTTSGKITGLNGTYFTYTCARLLDANGEEVKNEVGDTITEEYLTWNAEKLTTTELALEYFVYLDNSAGYDPNQQVDAGTYFTNEYATITYDNYQGNRVQQEFPIPQMTWNGAQVTYVFYLVNEAGQPVNRAGRVIPFAEAIYVTDPVTFNVTWNELEGSENMLARNLLASANVPDVFALYDTSAYYEIRVYQTEGVDSATQAKNYNYFIIEGGTDVTNKETTKVFNTKAGTKYDDYGAYSATAGSYLSHNSNTSYTATVTNDIDYANTTVAFAVVWKPELVEDTVVVDYGLDVIIDVATNDAMASGVVGVCADAPANVTINSGTYTAAGDKSADVKIDDMKIGTATVESLTSVRFSLYKDNAMQFTKAAKFYYESDVNYYKNNVLQTTSMYSSVTVIPATTVYYEDDFIQFASFTNDGNGNYVPDAEHKWVTKGQNGVQDQDRPGESKISAALDADNVYGYDDAYESMSTYSMGSAAMFSVTQNTRGEAYFDFYGTGFDVISLTSNTTGTIMVQVFDKSGAAVRSTVVDTYYGMVREFYEVTYQFANNDWVELEATKLDELGEVNAAPEQASEGDTYTTSEVRWTPTNAVEKDDTDGNALYQIPVIKIFDLPYDKYSVKIMAIYNDVFNHTGKEGGYDLYLDAIRIYNPTGNLDDTSNEAYVTDGEGYPEYFEVRDQIINKETFDILGEDEVSGIVYIDGGIAVPSVADYTTYGPNNEVYLENGNAIAFDLNATATAGKVAKVQLAVKSVGGTGKVEVYGIKAKEGVRTDCLNQTISTATDMYYDITALNGQTVVIKSTGDAIISITNVKVTYTEAQPEETEPAAAMFMLRRSSVDAALATMSVEEDIPEETVPEETVPEETTPEETVPEETVPEETVPEETTPEEPDDTTVEEVVEQVLEGIAKLIGKLFGKLFG